MHPTELSPPRDPDRPAPAAAADVVARCRAQGVVVLTAGAIGNVIRLLPPLVIADEELARGLDVIEASALAVAKESPSS
jgi:4-aminobutyrate aminotransferase/(S)-3-amino-2-methylpropionate transaminase